MNDPQRPASRRAAEAQEGALPDVSRRADRVAASLVHRLHARRGAHRVACRAASASFWRSRRLASTQKTDNRPLMRIATWNVNSLKARLDRVLEWLDRAQPDVLLMQETKLSDDDAPVMPFQMRGYSLVHHGEGRWNGVAIASKSPADAAIDRHQLRRRPGAQHGRGRDCRASRRTTSTRSTRRAWSAPSSTAFASCRSTRPTAGSSALPSLTASSRGTTDSCDWLQDNVKQSDALVVGGDMNIAPTAMRRLGRERRPWRHPRSQPEREAFAELLTWGLVDGYRSKRPEPRPLHVVGLPRGQLPQEPGHAHRPPAAVPPGRRNASSGQRSIARRARACRFHRIMRRCSSTSTSPERRSTPAGRVRLQRIAARTKR